MDQRKGKGGRNSLGKQRSGRGRGNGDGVRRGGGNGGGGWGCVGGIGWPVKISTHLMGWYQAHRVAGGGSVGGGGFPPAGGAAFPPWSAWASGGAGRSGCS